MLAYPPISDVYSAIHLGAQVESSHPSVFPLAPKGQDGFLLGPFQGWGVIDVTDGGRGCPKAQVGLVTWFGARMYKEKSRLEY